MNYSIKLDAKIFILFNPDMMVMTFLLHWMLHSILAGTMLYTILAKNCLHPILAFSWGAYGRNQSGCEKAKNVGFLPFILGAVLTINIFVNLMKIPMCFKQLEASHIMSWES